MRSIFYLVMLGTSGCTGCQIGTDRELENFTSQASPVVRAIARDDHQTVADHTHARLADAHGGREAYLKELTERSAKMNAAGLRFSEPVELDRPVIRADAAGVRYAFLSFRVTYHRPGSDGLGPTDFLVGVSDDGGKTWQFLDRMGIGSEERLREWFPNLPADFRLPSHGGRRSRASL
jgi:hypothetical protein